MGKLDNLVTVNGHTFEYNDDNQFYECRGEVMWDDEHDQMPEPSLWEAAKILATRLRAKGYKTDYQHSEKGWVEVNIYD